MLQRLPNAGRRQPGVHRRGAGPQRCSHRRHHARRRSRRVVVGWRVRVRAGGTGGGGRHAGCRRCLPRCVLVLLDPDREQCRRAHRPLRSRGGTTVFGGRAAGMAERTPQSNRLEGENGDHRAGRAGRHPRPVGRVGQGARRSRGTPHSGSHRRSGSGEVNRRRATRHRTGPGRRRARTHGRFPSGQRSLDRPGASWIARVHTTRSTTADMHG